MDCTGLLLVLASVIYSVTSQLSVTTSGGAAVSVGDTAIELICTVNNLDIYNQIAKWVKVDLKNKESSTVISAHNQIVAEDTIHYSIAAQGAPTGSVYTLSIAEIRSEDDGYYKCVVSANAKPLESLAESTEELVVRQPITSVVLNAGTIQVSASDGENPKTVELERLDPDLVIGCKVKGSNPEPKIELTVGGESILSEILRQDQVNIKGKNKKFHRTYDTDLDSTGKKSFDNSIIGKEITCTAWMEDGTPDQASAMTATIIINLKEPPKVECIDVTSRIGDRRVKLTCTIESIVKPDKITWFVVDNGDPLYIPATGSYHEEYIGHESDEGNNKYMVTLEIGQVEEKHFGNEYTLQATVPGDDIAHVVRLQQRESVDGGVGQVSMTVTFLMSSLLAGCLLRRWI